MFYVKFFMTHVFRAFQSDTCYLSNIARVLYVKVIKLLVLNEFSRKKSFSLIAFPFTVQYVYSIPIFKKKKHVECKTELPASCFVCNAKNRHSPKSLKYLILNFTADLRDHTSFQYFLFPNFLPNTVSYSILPEMCRFSPL